MSDQEKETVSCAAIEYRGKVYIGVRHPTILAKIMEDCGHLPKGGSHTDGFVTSRNRFVDRREAAKIAFAAGQTQEDRGVLYSEDIY